MHSSYQTTLLQPVTMSGVALHTGCEATITLRPAGPETGIVWRRVDLPGAPDIAALPQNVVNTQRCTVIGKGGAVVRTVEHVMAALRGLEVDNCIVEVDGEEPPAGDGSAAEFVALIHRAGLCSLPVPRSPVTLDAPVFVEEGRSQLVALPHDRLSISCVFANDRNHPALTHQWVEFGIDPRTFEDEIAAARTIGFLQEIEELRRQGLALGGNFDTAVVIGEDRILTPLRFPDEPARHKLLDLVGDLALLGHLHARIIAVRPSHRLNTRLTYRIAEQLGLVSGYIQSR